MPAPASSSWRRSRPAASSSFPWRHGFDAVLGYLADRPRWQAAQRQAAAASRSFSVEAMAVGFHDAFLRATEPRARLVQERG